MPPCRGCGKGRSRRCAAGPRRTRQEDEVGRHPQRHVAVARTYESVAEVQRIALEQAVAHALEAVATQQFLQEHRHHLSRKPGGYQLLTEEETRLEALRGMERFLRPDERVTCRSPGTVTLRRATPEQIPPSPMFTTNSVECSVRRGRPRFWPRAGSTEKACLSSGAVPTGSHSANRSVASSFCAIEPS